MNTNRTLRHGDLPVVEAKRAVDRLVAIRAAKSLLADAKTLAASGNDIAAAAVVGRAIELLEGVVAQEGPAS